MSGIVPNIDKHYLLGLDYLLMHDVMRSKIEIWSLDTEMCCL